MLNEQQRIYLDISVENDLYQMMQIIETDRVSDISNMNKYKEEAIKKFISELPDEYKKNKQEIENIIAQKLDKMGMPTKWGKVIIQKAQKNIN